MHSSAITLKVSASSSTQSVASAIAHNLDEASEVAIRAVGAGAVNQTVKALAVARGIVATRGKDLYFKVGFANVTGDTNQTQITALEFTAFVQ